MVAILGLGAARQEIPEITSQFLKNKHISLKKVSDDEIAILAYNILSIFGAKFVGAAIKGLNERITDRVHSSFHVFSEILRGKERPYTRDNFPLAAAFIDDHKNHGQAENRVFLDLKRQAGKFCPFPLTQEDKRERVHAFKLLLNPPDEMSSQEKITLSTLYFNRIALIHLNKNVTYAELLETWRACSEENHFFYNSLCKKILGRSAVEEGTIKPVPGLIIDGFNGSFHEFIVHSTLHKLEGNLDVKFTPSLRESLSELLENESLRIDLIMHTPYLLLKKVDEIGTSYPKIFMALQLFLISYHDHKDLKRSPELLEMLLEASSNLTKALFRRKVAKWHSLARKQSDKFPAALRCFFDLEKEIKAEKSSPEWNFSFLLFIFLWESTERCDYTEFFLSLSRYDQFTLSMQTIYRFCEVNGLKPKGAVLEDGSEISGLRLLLDAYLVIINTIERFGHEIRNIENLFLTNPPVDLRNPEELVALGLAQRRTLTFMVNLDLPIDSTFFKTLRLYLVKPREELFDLVKDAKLLGVEKVKSKMVYETLHALDGDVKVTPFSKEKGIAFSRRVAKKFHLDEKQSFLFYLIVLARSFNDFQSAFYMIDFLQRFCPLLIQRDIFFILKYVIAVPRDEMVGLSSLRDAWIRSDGLRRTFIVEPEMLRDFQDSIVSFLNALSESCKNEDERGSFVASMNNSLNHAFLPPLQPLVDTFRVKTFQARRVEWSAPYLKSHLGQMFSMQPDGHLKIYTNWTFHRGRPSLFFTFFNMETCVARSGSVTLNLDVKNNPRLAQLIFTISQNVLNEEVNGAYNPNYEFEKRETWQRAYPGLGESLDLWVEKEKDHKKRKGDKLPPEKVVSELLRFFRLVKIRYRMNYLALLGGSNIPKLSAMNPMEIARCGHVFSSKKVPSLLPDWTLEMHPEFYQLDEKIRFPRLDRAVRHFIPLRSSLIVTENGEERVEKPLYYKLHLPLKSIDLDDEKEAPEQQGLLTTIEDHIVTPLLVLGIETKSDDDKRTFLSVPVQYRAEVLAKPKWKRAHFKWQVLQLKAQYYRHL